MGLDSLTTTLDGETRIPQTPADWQDWVSATQTGNYINQSALSDWLGLYGEAHGFVRDSKLPGYDERLDFGLFIMGKGNEFEAAIVEHLRTLTEVRTVTEEWRDSRALDAATRVYEAMRDGVPVLHQAVLRDAESRTYGLADLLVRSDVFADLFPLDAGHIDPGAGAPGLEQPWHYVVVDVKFTSLKVAKEGIVGNDAKMLAYKAQLYVYNRALGRLQGYTPPAAFLLGRSFSAPSEKFHTTNALDRLAPVDLETHNRISSRGATLPELVENACEWLHRLRKEGSAWSPLPTPTVPELWPNPGNGGFDWSRATGAIAEQLGDHTLLWKVGARNRAKAHAAGVTSWRDPHTNLALLGMKPDASAAPNLQAILDVNHDESGPPVRPARISAGEAVWRATPPLEFFVDFEFVSGVNDDFERIPEQNGHPLTFMIGCGHVQDGKWVFRTFIAERLTERDEESMFEEWFEHMQEVKEERGGEAEPLLYHWAGAEPAQYRAAARRHFEPWLPETRWADLNWYDLLAYVIRREPVVVRGALGFGLKEFASALRSHGLIATDWKDTSVDGMGAMVGAWWCDEEAERLGVPLQDVPLMQEIAPYNEVDTKTMMEILHYLREHH